MNSSEVDIFLPSLNIAIEYDGFYFHKDRIKQDKNKNRTLKKSGIILIRVRERPLKTISRLDLVTWSQGVQKNDVDKLLQNIPFNEDETLFLIEDYRKNENFKFEYA
mgnify:FL=1